MLVGRIARWSLVTSMVFAVSTAVAQTDSPVRGPGGAKIRAACGDDLQRFCVDVRPGGGRLIQCLSSHVRELSEVCGNLINAAGGGAKLRAACADDLQRFCPGVQPGKGHLIQCLSAHTREVSAACENMITTKRPQRGTPNSIAQNPAAQPAAPVIVGNLPPTMGSIFRASCGPDAQRLCAGARREIDVLKCLDSRRRELSAVCNSYFQKSDASPAAQKNIPNKKPPLPPATHPAKPPGIDKTEPGPG
jgi:hypothetical protein